MVGNSQDLAREMKKLWDMKVRPFVFGAPGMISQNLERHSGNWIEEEESRLSWQQHC